MASFRSTYTAGVYQTHTVFRTGTNGVGPYSEIGFGDNNKVAGSDERWSSIQSWELGNPDPGVGGSVPIPKYADIANAYIEFVPVDDKAGSGDQLEHRIALVASDGHWDRSRQNVLHIDQQNLADGNSPSATFSAPSFASHVNFTVFKKNSVIIAETMTETTDPDDTVLDTGPAGDFTVRHRMAIGTTVEIPAGEEVYDVVVRMCRRINAVANPVLTMGVYALRRNGRQYAVDQLISRSLPINYADLPLNATDPASEAVLWEFVPALTTDDLGNADEAQWIGLLVEGLEDSSASSNSWFRPALQYFNPLLFQFRETTSGDQEAYLDGSAGSMFFASRSLVRQFQNSFPYYYNSSIDVPSVYETLSTNELRTPYIRFFGSVMAKTVDPNWTSLVPVTYGAEFGNDGTIPTNIFPEFVTNVQNWIDSEFYTPRTGETWIGLIMEVLDPDNFIWSYYSSTNTLGFEGIKLVIDWSPRAPTILGEDVKDVTFVDIPATDQVAAIWTIKLRNTTYDLLKVSGLESVDAVASLTDGVTAEADLLVDGHNLVVLTPSSEDISGDVMVATLHRRGAINNLSIDENIT